MNEKSRRIVAVLLISAVAALVASPFAPAFASDSGQAGAEASFAAGTVGEEEAAGEVAAPAIKGMAAPEAGATSDGITAGSMTRPGGEQGEPWEVTSLDISKGVDTVTAPGVEIGLEKAASRSRIEMSVGDKAEVAFTIDVSAEWSDSCYIAGDIFVANTGEWPADVTAVSDTVWYKAGGPSWLAAASSIGTTVPLGDDAIPTGGPHTYSYSGTFTLPVPLASVTALSNLIEITISNKPDPPKPGMRSWTFRYREDFAKPAGGGPTMVSLQDIEGITPWDGLSHEVRKVTLNGAETADLTGPWALDLAVSPFTVVIEKELSAEKAGRYTLHNKAKIGELEDEADVDIVVTQDVRPGSITGFKYEDLDADGELDVGEPPFKGIAIELWREGLSAEVAAGGGIGPLGAATWLKVGEAATAADGSYRFGGLEPGYYMVREVLPDGVFASGPLEVFAGVDAGQDVVVETPFLNYRLGGVTVHKWLDLDGDGVHQESEPPLAGVKVILEGGGLSEESVTGAAGTVAFMDLHPGSYLVREELPGGYRATSAVEKGFILVSGEKEEVHFLNAELPGVVRGHKYLDLDADARLDGGESGLAGVTIRLLDAEGRVMATTVSGSDGSYIFEGLRAGKYTVEEMVPDGYAATAPVAVAFTLALDEAKEVDFFNRVLVAGDIVTPPAPPAIAPEVQPGATQTLPVTGLDIGRLLVLIGLLILAGAFVASLGIARLAR